VLPMSVGSRRISVGRVSAQSEPRAMSNQSTKHDAQSDKMIHETRETHATKLFCSV
jgi:hypothetical protein